METLTVTSANEIAFAKCPTCEGVGYTDKSKCLGCNNGLDGGNHSKHWESHKLTPARCTACIGHPGYIFGNVVREQCPCFGNFYMQGRCTPCLSQPGWKVGLEYHGKWCELCSNEHNGLVPRVTVATLVRVGVAIGPESGQFLAEYRGHHYLKPDPKEAAIAAALAYARALPGYTAPRVEAD